ncbi:protein YgfX [Vibrio anguillarum]|uniref:protein YgfX n=2 Tax=Vibrio anguillarum TaxID=55601 RepID=UPI002E181448
MVVAKILGMRQWWIKLLLTTSAKCVNFVLFPSHFARITNFICLMIAVWALLISPIPLVTLPLFYAPLITAQKSTSLLVPSLIGQFKLTSHGEWQCADQNLSIEKVSTQFAFMVLIIYAQQGKRYLVWRDSCVEADYRRLLVQLRQVTHNQSSTIKER